MSEAAAEKSHRSEMVTVCLPPLSETDPLFSQKKVGEKIVHFCINTLAFPVNLYLFGLYSGYNEACPALISFDLSYVVC